MRALIVYISILIVILASCSEKNRGKKTSDQSSNDMQVQTVEVIHPEMRSLSSSLEIAGNAHANQSVDLYSMESGMVKRVRKDIGDAVSKGEVLIELKNPELFRKQAEKKADFETKNETYKRLRATASQTPALVPSQMLDEAKGKAAMAEAALGAVNDRISFLNVRAPFSGVISERFVDEGALVQSGIESSSAQAVLRIVELDPIRFKIPVPESEVSAIQNGDSVKITFPELGDLEIESKISRISYALDEQSKSMAVEVDLPNKNGHIRPGMYGRAEFYIQSERELMVVPATAKLVRGKGEYVLMVEDGKVRQVSVKGGVSTKDYIQVNHDDISLNSEIIVQGKNLVKDGETVEAILKSK